MSKRLGSNGYFSDVLHHPFVHFSSLLLCSFDIFRASLSDGVMGGRVSPPDDVSIALFFTTPRASPEFVPLYGSGYALGPVDKLDGLFMFAQRDFSVKGDGRFIEVGLASCRSQT